MVEFSTGAPVCQNRICFYFLAGVSMFHYVCFNSFRILFKLSLVESNLVGFETQNTWSLLCRLIWFTFPPMRLSCKCPNNNKRYKSYCKIHNEDEYWIDVNTPKWKLKVVVPLTFILSKQTVKLWNKNFFTIRQSVQWSSIIISNLKSVLFC